jgi:hypothetical protein
VQAGQHRISAGGVLCAYLDPATFGQHGCDRLEPVGGPGRVDIQSEVGQVQGQPSIRGWIKECLSQGPVVAGDAVRLGGVGDQLPEQVDTDAVSGRQ